MQWSFPSLPWLELVGAAYFLWVVAAT